MKVINLGNKLFKNEVRIPKESDIIFVSDSFASEVQGGAELTTKALIESCPLNVFHVHSKDITMKLLEEGFQKYWIFGNFMGLDRSLIPSICANLQYSVIEYDYKYCKYRSTEKHKENELRDCDCHKEEQGLMISAFFHGAKSLWWMSEQQEEIYGRHFPFLKEKINSTVLSSVFDNDTLAKIKLLKEKYKNKKNDKWIILNSPSWIKGAEDAVTFCEKNNLPYEKVWGLPYEALLEKLALSEGLVFLPKGKDTCPRLVIEAKLLDCKLELNENVQHKNEAWFNTDDILDTQSYLYLCRERFWNGIKHDMSYKPTISGYTTTKDCIKQDYPFEECIKSMLGFCDEVIVVDGGSTDGTWEKLKEIAHTKNNLVVHQQKRDWNAKRFAVFDGMQKALARSLCTGDMCWQMDSDEVVHEDDYAQIHKIAKFLPKNIPIIGLPVIEYWGSTDKVRVDVPLWKWRLSRNMPHITHGVPSQLRRFDEDGNLYSAPGSDGCFYVRSDNYDIIPCANFVTPDVEQVQAQAKFNAAACNQLQKWFELTIGELPPVYHFSWFNIERKIHTYKNYWSKHWESLYNSVQEDTVDNNKFFDKKWSDVTDEEIKELASKLKEDMGGWVFHEKIDMSNSTLYMKLNKEIPSVMKGWVGRNK